MAKKATNEQIITAYKDTGTVWETAKRLGMCGQSVWERLRALGYPMASQNWTDAEKDHLRELAGTVTITEITNRLGRPYLGVAGMISRLGLAGRYNRRRQRKENRQYLYPEASVQRWMGELQDSSVSIKSFARANSLDLELLVKAIQRQDHNWWLAYCQQRSKLPEKTCPHCDKRFVPMTAKQKTCSRKCSERARADKQYFGGNLKNTVGLAEGKCQVCGRQAADRLASHHVFGKRNDPKNEHLLAVCNGCHQIVGRLAACAFIESEGGWENLIGLVLARRLADQPAPFFGVHVSVDIERLTAEDGEWINPDQSPLPPVLFGLEARA
jgi:hypothetical protein